jgi:bacteriorhodopsin
MAVLLLSWSFRRAAGWRTIYRATLFIALGMLAAFLSMAADVGMPGLQQRAFLLLFLLWLSIVIHRFVRLRAGAA